VFVEQTTLVNESTKRNVVRYVYDCDHCHKRFIKGRFSEKFRFCSRDCLNESQRSGVVKIEKEKHFMQKYGSKNPYGAKSVIDARKAKSIEKYGVENPSQRPDVKIKKAATFTKHYETTNNFGRPEVREKTVKTLLERFGSVAPTTHPSVKIKLRSPEVLAKRFASLKKNGSIMSSKPERRLVKMLQEVHGDVINHLTVNKWSIDAYVPSTSTYVQLDGIYWHGLDRPLDVIHQRASKGSAIDAEILNKVKRDRDADVWFSQQCLRLVRVTDVEVNVMNDEQLREWCVDFSKKGSR